ncbi:hypothetical protein BVI1335_870014 [Burkholderia vietnamiensis]|nr:hypothetical protein BVI1335_870014 [Burkholderia vietnamiensis]
MIPKEPKCSAFRRVPDFDCFGDKTEGRLADVPSRIRVAAAEVQDRGVRLARRPRGRGLSRDNRASVLHMRTGLEKHRPRATLGDGPNDLQPCMP